MVQERGEEKQKFYKGGGGKLGQGVGALKSGGEGGGGAGAGTPLWTIKYNNVSKKLSSSTMDPGYALRGKQLLVPDPHPPNAF